MRYADYPEDRRPVIFAADLDTLDPAEIEEGYHDGREGFPCGENRGRAYYHGWRNGMIDSGRMEKDVWAGMLARDVMQRERVRAVLAPVHGRGA